MIRFGNLNKKFRKLLSSSEERRRLLEIFFVIIISIILFLLSKLEGNLLSLSHELSKYSEFFTTVLYFGLINTNVLLILILGFLIFRNIVKHVIERKRGVIGSRLRSKLLFALLFFALAPTALLFYVSTRFLTNSFETWFSSQIKEIIYQTQEAGSLIYERDKLRVESLARIALSRIRVQGEHFMFNEGTPSIIIEDLIGFSSEYSIDGVMVYDQSGKILWMNRSDLLVKENEAPHNLFVTNSLNRFSRFKELSSRGIEVVEQSRDVVKGIAPIRLSTGELIGGIVTVQKLKTQIIGSLESILKKFIELRPGAELIKLSYIIILILIVFIVLFSATWLGFYVAKGLVAPIQTLALATRKVASGQYDIELTTKTDDEIGMLIKSFNKMTLDLKAHEKKVSQFTMTLEKTNEELERRRKYMEVVLKNISAGVISVDSDGKITTFNDTAKKLLELDDDNIVGAPLEAQIPKKIMEQFWQPILIKTKKDNFYQGQIEIELQEGKTEIFANGSRILEENGEDLGIVVVFDDASEQVKVQRMTAWREVARRIAHEVKNPITPIKLSAERLLRKFGKTISKEDDREVFEQCIETIVSEVDSLRDLVNQFSKFSKMPTVSLRAGDITLVISEVVSLFSVSYPDIHIQLERSQSKLPLIKIDKEQMKRVFINLITNSVHALQKNSSEKVINIRIKMNQDEVVVIDVVDNGPGIPDSIKNRVTEPYFSTKKEGTGLGLAIVQQIISDHGGYFKIVPNQSGGTKVTIELPLG